MLLECDLVIIVHTMHVELVAALIGCTSVNLIQQIVAQGAIQFPNTFRFCGTIKRDYNFELRRVMSRLLRITHEILLASF